jgi:outer membrane protein assembly factor BamB
MVARMKILTLSWLGAFFVTAVHSADWPAWRGADGLGHTPERNLPIRWSEHENVKWKAPLPDRGNSTPIVQGNKVFVTQALEKENERTLMCFNRADGRLLWQKGVTWTAKEESHETNPFCSSSPVTDGERVIVWFGSAGVVCYDLNGKELWRHDLGPQAHGWGYGSSPLIHGDLCILYHGPARPGFLVALDKRTGEIKWKTQEPPVEKRPRTDGFRGKEEGGQVGTFGSPLLIKAGGRDELIMAFPQLLCAFDPATGKELWRCDGLNELIYASPVYGDGLVVAMGGFFGSAIAVKPGGAGDVTKTARIWRDERAKKNRCGSGVVADGHLFLANMEGFVECIDVKTGVILWSERLPAKGPKSESWSSMVLSGDLIYVLNQSGDCVVLRASPKFEVVTVNPLDSALTNASLAVSDGELFIRTHKHLWCITRPKETAAAE